MQSQTNSDPIAQLWTAARAMFARLASAVGEPAAIAARDAFDTKHACAVRAWLRPLEAMVRKIVLIEAMALARQPAPPPALPMAKPARAKPNRARRAYRIGFRLWPRQPISAGPRIRSLGPPMRVIDINRDRARLALAQHLNRVRCMHRPEHERLAGRVAALAHVIAKPFAAIGRLARKLRALPKLALKLACRRPPRTRLYDDPAMALTEMHAFAAARAFLDSS
jgi:hypothetical protein